MPARDPWEALRRLEPRRSSPVIVAAVAAALCSHTAAIASPNMTMLPLRTTVRALRAELGSYFAGVSVEVETEPAKPEPEAKEPEPEAKPEPEPEKEPDKPEPVPAAKAEPPPEAKPSDNPYGEEPRAAAAEAPDVVAQDEGTDLNWTMVTKPGSKSTGGGYTSNEGTAQHPVRDPHAGARGREGAHGTGDGAPPVKAVDHSRPAMPLSRNLSDCPFPPQADMAQVDRAVVDVAVTVDPSGRPTSAQVMADPGFGFGGQARRCALSMRYQPALGADGEPITGTTPTLRFRFNR